MLKIETVSSQLRNVREQIRDTLTACPSPYDWMYGEIGDQTSFNAYVSHFQGLRAFLDSPDAGVAYRTRERFRFIETDTMSALIDAELYADWRAGNPWEALLNHTLLLSRTQALALDDITAHYTTGEIFRLPLCNKVSNATVRKFLRDELDRGNLVRGERNAREYWWAPSVAAITQWWIQRLSWFCVRSVMLSRISNYRKQHHRSYWVDELGMPGEIFDEAIRKDWSLLSANFVEALPANLSLVDA